MRLVAGHAIPLVVITTAVASAGWMRSVRCAADGVHPTFMRIAADLAGIVLTKSELEATAKVVTAEIVNHPQHDPNQAPLQLKKEKSVCSLM